MNNFPLNSVPLNVGKFLPELPDGLLVFNGHTLCSNTTPVATEDNRYDLPTFILTSYKSPLTDNGGVQQHLIGERTLDFTIYIKGDSIDDFGQKVLTLKKAIARQEGILKIKIAGIDMYIKASVIDFSAQRQSDEKSGTFSLTFKALENYHDNFKTYAVYPSITADFQGGLVNEGMRRTDLSFYVSFAAAVGVTDITISTNEFPISVSAAFNPGDILFINADTGDVQINGIDVEYEGSIPVLRENYDSAGFNVVEFEFNPGAVFDAAITMFYVKQYI